MASARDAESFSDYPKKLTVALTDRCNLKCFICTREEFERDTNGRGQHMPMTDLHRLEAPLRQAEVVQLSGFGESFLYPHLDEALDFIYGINARPDLIYMISNGTLLSRHWAERLDGRLNYLAISLNASNPDEYRRDMHPYLYRYTRQTAPEAYRGKQFAEDNGRERPCEFERTVARIREFASALSDHSRARVGLHYVVHSENMANLIDFVELAHDLGLSKVEFNPYLVNRVENIDHSIYFHKEAYNASLQRALDRADELGVRVQARPFGTEARRPFNRGRDCQWPFEEALVLTDGRISPCCFGGPNFMGNAFDEDTDFDGIWFGAGYRRLRHERWLNACHRCNLFHTIDDWQTHFHPRVKARAVFQDKVVDQFEDGEARRATRVLVLGAGRDGTRSMGRLLENLHMANGEQVHMLHEAEGFRTADGVLRYLAEGDGLRLTEALKDWRSEIVATNLLGFALPAVRKLFGRGLKVVHLKRERAACVASLLEQARREPLYWTAYLEQAALERDEDAEAVLAALQPVRPTAVLMGEMTAAQWLACEPAARMGWYYDALHAAIESGLKEFTEALTVETETLSRPETVRRVADFVRSGWRAEVAPVHLNASAYRLSGALEADDARHAQELLADLDLWQVRASDTHAVIFFLQRWLDRHGTAPGSEIVGELSQIGQTIDELVASAEQNLMPAVDDRLLAEATAELADGALGLEPIEKQQVARGLAGLDWHRASREPVYPVLFCLRRLAALHAGDGGPEGSITQTLRFLRQQVDALQQKLPAARKAQAAA